MCKINFANEIKSLKSVINLCVCACILAGMMCSIKCARENHRHKNTSNQKLTSL